MSGLLGRAVLTAAALLALSGCVPQSYSNPPPRAATPSPTPTAVPTPTAAPTPPPETFVVGTDVTHNAISLLSVDTASGVLTPVAAERSVRGVRRPSQTVLVSGTALPAGCSPGAMTVSERELAIVCMGLKMLEVFSIAPGSGTSLTIDLAGVQSCPLGANPWLLRSARMRESDGPHTIYEVLDRTSYQFTICDSMPAGLHAVGSYTLPSPRIPIDFTIRSETGLSYPFYETHLYTNATVPGVSLYGLTEGGSRTLINELPSLSGTMSTLLDDCDGYWPSYSVLAGLGSFSSLNQTTPGGPLTEMPITTAPFTSTHTGPTWVNSLGTIKLNSLPYLGEVGTGNSFNVFAGNYSFLTSTPTIGNPLSLHGYGGSLPSFGTLYTSGTTSTLSTYRFDGTTLSPRIDYSLNYQLSDFGYLSYGYPRTGSTPAPTPTPTPGTSFGAVMLHPTFLAFSYLGQTQTFTASQSGNTGNSFTFSPITCPSGNNGAGTITQPSPGSFNVTVTSPSGSANCQSTITGLGGFSATMGYNF